MPQSLVCIHAHIIFSTKNRVPFLRDAAVRNQMHAYLAEAYRGQECPVFVVGGTEDHVHVLCTLSKNRCIKDVIRDTKRGSSQWIKTVGESFRDFHWQSGYGAFSVSHSNMGRVRQYIATQEEHHRTRSFQDEFRAFLKKHGVEYDERYVWD